MLQGLIKDFKQVKSKLESIMDYQELLEDKFEGHSQRAHTHEDRLRPNVSVSKDLILSDPSPNYKDYSYQ